jgi:hypothetical protein
VSMKTSRIARDYAIATASLRGECPALLND